MAIQQDRVANATKKQEANYKKAKLQDVSKNEQDKNARLAKLLSGGNEKAELTLRSAYNKASIAGAQNRIAKKAVADKQSLTKLMDEMARLQMKDVKTYAGWKPFKSLGASSKALEYLKERESRKKK